MVVNAEITTEADKTHLKFCRLANSSRSVVGSSQLCDMNAGQLVFHLGASPLMFRYAGRWFKDTRQPSRSGVQQRRVQRSAEMCVRVARSGQSTVTVRCVLAFDVW